MSNQFLVETIEPMHVPTEQAASVKKLKSDLFATRYMLFKSIRSAKKMGVFSDI